MILSEAVGDLRADDNSTSQSDEKISQIEIELEEIAQNVKMNIGQIFERGEKFGILASKSEALKTSVGISLSLSSNPCYSHKL